jgi:hypothetical protein
MHDETQHSQPGAGSAGTADRSSGGSVTTADLTDETFGSRSLAGAGGSSSSSGDGRADPAETGVVPTFLHVIARQMQAAAEGERERIAADAAKSLEAHIQKVRTRASKEAEELRRLAEEDVVQIHAWSADESERLRLETESRIGARQDDLERHLRQHDALVEREIAGASEAVEAYRTELDRFVGRLAVEREPTDIAQLASQLPEPPSVEEVASAARAEAMAQLSSSEGADDVASASLDPVGVMDPGVINQTADPRPQQDTPALVASSSSEDERVDQDPGRPLGARSSVDLLIRVVVVVVLVALIATLAFLLVTGQVIGG